MAMVAAVREGTLSQISANSSVGLNPQWPTAALDTSNGLPKVYHMPTIATKLSADLANRVQRMASSRKTTVSSLVRKAVESEVSGRPGETFGDRFGHLFGAAKRLPANASRKEAYED
jgi:hypothetical protein